MVIFIQWERNGRLAFRQAEKISTAMRGISTVMSTLYAADNLLREGATGQTSQRRADLVLAKSDVTQANNDGGSPAFRQSVCFRPRVAFHAAPHCRLTAGLP